MLGLTLVAISSGNLAYGGVILIGPIPIVFGSTPTLAAIGAIIGVIFLLLAYIFIIHVFRYKLR